MWTGWGLLDSLPDPRPGPRGAGGSKGTQATLRVQKEYLMLCLTPGAYYTVPHGVERNPRCFQILELNLARRQSMGSRNYRTGPWDLL